VTMSTYAKIRTWYQVSEIFDAPQGEGHHIGTMSTFIRLQGCIVGCSWCDTKYTWGRGGEKMPLHKIMEQVHFDHVVITGGEPTQWDLGPLVAELKMLGCTVQIETSGLGQKPLPDHIDWVTCSPKEPLHFTIGLNYIPNEFKFVVDDTFDMGVAIRLYQQYKTLVDEPVFEAIEWYLMPEGNPPTQEHCDRVMALLAKHPTFKFGGRLHTWINSR
jgi:7-carboxy-7-deazaguanine synthase